MVARVENKIDYHDVNNNDTFGSVKGRLLSDLQANGVSVTSQNQIRLIYSGRILKDDDRVGSIRSDLIKPPYTLQVVIRLEGFPSEDQNPPANDNSMCILI